VNASEKMRITSTGNVGIGTNDPQSLLHASGSAQNILEIDSSDGDGPYAVYRTSGTSKGFVGSAAALANAGQSNFAVRAQADLVFAAGGSTERMRIDSSGNVGIGTAASDGNLHVRKTGINTGITNVLMNANFADGSNGTGLSIGYRTDETTAVLAARTATGNIAFYSYDGGWSESMRIANTGIVKINTTAVNARFRVDEGGTGEWVAGFKHTGTTPYGVFIDTSGNTSTGYTLGCYTNTNTGLFLKNDGRLGIGTTSPSAPVHIKSATEGMLWLDSSGNTASLQFRDNGIIRGLIGFSNGSSIFVGADDHDMVLRSESKMHFVSATSAHGISIDANGKVGIGTTSPNAKLQVNSSTAGNVTGAYFTNSQANSGAEKVSIAFGLNRSGGDFIRSTQAITFGSEQQWTGTPSSVRGYLQFSTMQDESEGARMRISSQGLISSQNTVTSHSRRRDYTYTGDVANGATVDLIENSSAYTDVTFILFMEIFHSGRTYRVIKGSFGGYGLNISSSGSGIGINQQVVATGRAKLRISNTTGYDAGVHIHAIIIGDPSITVHNGVLATEPQ
jgi:hypothetical protein